MMASKLKGPRLFVSVPWRELLELYVRVVGTPGDRKRLGAIGANVSELVNTWNRHIGEPRGFRVRRWKYDEVTDRVVMDLEWLKIRRFA